MAMEWEREEDVIAQRFEKNEIPGFLNKDFTARENEFLVIEKGNEIYRERGPGKFSIGALAGGLTGVLLLDKSEKTIEGEIRNVWLADNMKSDIKLTIKFRIFHSGRFSRNLMGEKKIFSVDDLWNEILSRVLYKRILPEIGKKASKDLQEEEASKSVERETKRAFRKWGIVMESLSLKIEFSGKDGYGHDDSKQSGGKAFDRNVKKYDTEMKGEIPGIGKGPEKSGDGPGGIKEEIESEGEEHEEKKLLLEIEKLKRAKEITESKFYKKELSQEAFERMMEDFEKRIIEIESVLKKQRGN